MRKSETAGPRRLSEVERLKNEVVDLRAELGSLRQEIKGRAFAAPHPPAAAKPPAEAYVRLPEAFAFAASEPKKAAAPPSMGLPKPAAPVSSKAATIAEKQAKAKAKLESLHKNKPEKKSKPAKPAVAALPAPPKESDRWPPPVAVLNPYADVRAAAVASSAAPQLEDGGIDAGIAKAAWERELMQTSLVNFTLKESSYSAVNAQVLLALSEEFKTARRAFLFDLAQNRRSDLERLGLKDDEIADMKEGRLPLNYSVMLKVPHMCGGSNDASNLLLIQTRPFAREAEGLIVQQIAYRMPSAGRSRRVWLPVYDGEVYIPPAGLTGSGGVSTSIDPAVISSTMSNAR